MINVQIEAAGLLKTLNSISDNIVKDTKDAANKTATKGVSLMAKGVSSEIRVSQKRVKRHIKKRKIDGGASVELEKSDRLALKAFKPVQRKTGVRYKIKKGGSLKTIRHAFMGPRPGVLAAKLNGHVFVRKNVFAPRKPIRRAGRGPSPWGVLAKNPSKLKSIQLGLQVELRKQLQKRIQFIKYKQKG